MRVKGCRPICLLCFSLLHGEAGRGLGFAASLGSEEYRIGPPVPRKHLPAVRPNLLKVTVGLIQESAFDKCS